MAVATYLDAHVMGTSSLVDRLLGPLIILYLVGGYEFLMEQCASFETLLQKENIGSHLAC